MKKYQLIILTVCLLALSANANKIVQIQLNDVNTPAAVSSMGTIIDSDTYTYISLAPSTNLNEFFAATDDATGIKHFDNNGSGWNAGASLTPTVGTIYTAVGKMYNGTNTFFGAKAGGGVDQIAPTWIKYQLDVTPHNIPLLFEDITMHNVTNNQFFGAVSADDVYQGSGIAQCYLSGTWTYTMLVPTKANNYVAICEDGAQSKMIFAARDSGGIDQMVSTDSWQPHPLTPANGKIYISLASRPGKNKEFLAALDTGGIERIWWDTATTSWKSQLIAGTENARWKLGENTGTAGNFFAIELDIRNCDDIYLYGQEKISDLEPDCVIDFKDFAILAGQWLECNDPVTSNCPN